MTDKTFLVPYGSLCSVMTVRMCKPGEIISVMNVMLTVN